jgi:membrane protein
MAYFGETILMTVLNHWFGELNNFKFIILKVVIFIFTIFTNSILFTIVLKYVNDGYVKWKSALYGALVTSILLYLGQLIINHYLSNYFFGSKSGVAGTLLVLMAWIYYTSQIIFIGAKFTKIYSQAIGEPIKFESRRKVFKKSNNNQNQVK